MRGVCWVLAALLLTSCATLVDLFDPTPDWCPGRKERRSPTIADCVAYGEFCVTTCHGFEKSRRCDKYCPNNREHCLVRCVPKPSGRAP